jgi:hypothetical protein
MVLKSFQTSSQDKPEAAHPVHETQFLRSGAFNTPPSRTDDDDFLMKT